MRLPWVVRCVVMSALVFTGCAAGMAPLSKPLR